MGSGDRFLRSEIPSKKYIFSRREEIATLQRTHRALSARGAWSGDCRPRRCGFAAGMVGSGIRVRDDLNRPSKKRRRSRTDRSARQKCDTGPDAHCTCKTSSGTTGCAAHRKTSSEKEHCMQEYIRWPNLQTPPAQTPNQNKQIRTSPRRRGRRRTGPWVSCSSRPVRGEHAHAHERTCRGFPTPQSSGLKTTPCSRPSATPGAWKSSSASATSPTPRTRA